MYIQQHIMILLGLPSNQKVLENHAQNTALEQIQRSEHYINQNWQQSSPLINIFSNQKRMNFYLLHWVKQNET